MAFSGTTLSKGEDAVVRLFTRGGRFCAVAAFVASALAGNAHANTLSVGPVEQVNLKSSTIVVLGQTYLLGSKTAVADSTSSSAISLKSLSTGELVSISGTETSSGTTQVDRLVVLPSKTYQEQRHSS